MDAAASPRRPPMAAAHGHGHGHGGASMTATAAAEAEAAAMGLGPLAPGVPVALEQVQLALQVMYTPRQVPARITIANVWLQDFQKLPDAWRIATEQLRDPTLARPARLFFAQTLRQKTRHDVLDLPDHASRAALRESLCASVALPAIAGDVLVRLQLCLALADLALQGEWERPVPDMLARFSPPGTPAPPAHTRVLIDFLRVLPEELNGGRLQLDRRQMIDLAERVLRSAADETLQFLLGVLEAGVHAGDEDLQAEVLTTIESWLRDGDLDAVKISDTPITQYLIHCLQPEHPVMPNAFQAAAELVTALTRVRPDTPFFQQILGHLPTMTATLTAMTHDPVNDGGKDAEFARGACNLVGAVVGCWLDLILDADLGALVHIVNVLLACTDDPDLALVQYTFDAWFTLTSRLLDFPNPAPLELCKPAYLRLVDIVIRLLRYPEPRADPTGRPTTPGEALAGPLSNHFADAALFGSAQDHDDFKEFRYAIGDLLKDCVLILGEEVALSIPAAMVRPYCDGDALQAATAAGTPGLEVPSAVAAATPTATTPVTPAGLPPHVSWQALEAPMFALRAMGKEVSPRCEILSQIIASLPALPRHPKILYAAILVIGRYSDWTAAHPEFLPSQLEFVISHGFNDTVSMAAAAQTLKYICESCGHHMVRFLRELHQFYLQILSRGNQAVSEEDKLQVTEALAHVIAALSLIESGHTYLQFAQAIGEQLASKLAEAQQHQTTSAGMSADALNASPIVQDSKTLMRQFACLTEYVRPHRFVAALQGHTDPQGHGAGFNSGSQMDALMDVNRRVQGLLQTFWQVTNAFLDVWPQHHLLGETIGRLFRGLFAGCHAANHLRPLYPTLYHTIGTRFDASRDASWLWIFEQSIKRIGRTPRDVVAVEAATVSDAQNQMRSLYRDNRDGMIILPDPELETLIGELHHRVSQATFVAMQATSLQHDPDLVDDFFGLQTELLKRVPHVIHASGTNYMALLGPAAACLEVEHLRALETVLTFLRELVCAASETARDSDLTLRHVLQTHCGTLLTQLYRGMLFAFPLDSALFGDVGVLIRDVCAHVLPPEGVADALLGALDAAGISEAQCPTALRHQHVAALTRALGQSSRYLGTAFLEFATQFRRRNLSRKN